MRLTKPRRSLPGLLVASILAVAPPAQAARVSDSLSVVSATNRGASASQAKIDELSRQTNALLEEYRRLQEGADYEAANNRELEALDAAQRAQIARLKDEIDRAKITRQRIVPLMRSMADALEQFVVLDLPFQHDQRIEAVLQLKQRIDRPDIAIADRFRLVLEAFQLEQDYGDTIDAWRGPLEQDGEQVSVEFLRVGRLALYYQTPDGRKSGYWNALEGRWTELDERYNRTLAQAMRVAMKQGAPRLLELPMRSLGTMP